jgi:hypothetical protein
MSTKSIYLAVLLAGASLLSACASRDEVAALRQPAMPPLAVAKASPARPFFRNVAVQAVDGAPEGRLFAGGALITTRPTRLEIVESLSDHLRHADMLAPSRQDAEYMLYATFEDLRGPNVWTGSDKRASARIAFRLVRWRTGEVVRERTVDAVYESHWTGLTPGGVATPAVREISADKEITPVLNGYDRRLAATRGLMDLAFDKFMGDLGRDGSVVYKTAVSCRALNGDAGRGPYLAETAGAYAIDCPGARYNDAKTAKAYPSQF